MAGRGLTLKDLARVWLGAGRIRAPLKAPDRLLGDRNLHAERERIHTAMNHWLVRNDQPAIVGPHPGWRTLTGAAELSGRITM